MFLGKVKKQSHLASTSFGFRSKKGFLDDALSGIANTLLQSPNIRNR